uniref:Uncharacterized protein n=1 Tax=Trypanosoma brucei brucei (strain 927/4 GUTat10.1) TaxID=185431 RepID=Q4FKP1_TRYB2|nr:hypothetical protein Tb10.v4.0049 [Trypanosoma brucei brucei TREU927]
MTSASVFFPATLCVMESVSVIRASNNVNLPGRKPACCGCRLHSTVSHTRLATILSMSLQRMLVSVMGRNDDIHLTSLLGLSSGTITPCFHFSGTRCLCKLQLKSLRTHYLLRRPNPFNCLQCISSLQGAVPEENSFSAVPSAATFIGLRILRSLDKIYSWKKHLVLSLTASYTFALVY